MAVQVTIDNMDIPIIKQVLDKTVNAFGRSKIKDIRLIKDRNVLPFHTTFTTKVEKKIKDGKEILEISSADVA